MPARTKIVRSSNRVATVTSKGQITLPVEIRRLLGANAGDKLEFEATADGVRISRQDDESRFEKYLGIGNGIEELDGGREDIIRYMRELRGHSAYDDPDFRKKS